MANANHPPLRKRELVSDGCLPIFPKIIEAYLTTGDYDYLLKVAAEIAAGNERFLRESLRMINVRCAQGHARLTYR